MAFLFFYFIPSASLVVCVATADFSSFRYFGSAHKPSINKHDGNNFASGHGSYGGSTESYFHQSTSSHKGHQPSSIGSFGRYGSHRGPSFDHQPSYDNANHGANGGFAESYQQDGYMVNRYESDAGSSYNPQPNHGSYGHFGESQHQHGHPSPSYSYEHPSTHSEYGSPYKKVHPSSLSHKVSCIGFPDGTLIGDINTGCRNFFSCINGYGILLTCPGTAS